jgi:hypothetical protein
MAESVPADYENAYCTVRWVPEGEYLYVEWRDAPTSEQYHAAHEAAVEVLSQHRGTKVVFDTRPLKVVQAHDQAWFTADLMPRFVVAGLKYSAVVVPASPVGALSVDRIVSTDTQRGLRRETQSFTSLEEAESWLASVD